MKAIDYLEMEQQANGPFDLPDFFFEPGTRNPDFDRGMQWLEVNSYIKLNKEAGTYTYLSGIEEDFPDVHRFLKCVHQYEVQELLDSLVDKGLVEVALDEDGELVYGLTQLGLDAGVNIIEVDEI